MRVTIATKAWNGASAAERLTDANAAVQIPWVEIDGVRYDNVIAATIDMCNGVQELTLKLIAATEVVLVGKDGEVIAE